MPCSKHLRVGPQRGRRTAYGSWRHWSGGGPVTVGGGWRRGDDARGPVAAGADKVSVNTAALRRRALLAELATECGSQCVVLAIDARRTGKEGRWEALAFGGREPGRPD